MLTLAACLSLVAGWIALALAMPRHHRQLRQREPGRREQIALRAGGWACLLASAMLVVPVWGRAIGPVAWFGIATAGGLGFVFLLPYLARRPDRPSRPKKR